ncbi:MAG TPA: TonB-dependent receptor [Rhizomicrobium sp.]|nr:TonB-dependent receptor [Rhizomicrobium sp.]
MARHIKTSVAAAASLVLFSAPAIADDNAVETVVVTGSALPGTSLNANEIPLSVQTISADDLTRGGQASLLRALDSSANGISFSDAQDNPFQPNVYYHGFQASPLAGDAQGLAVYVDGVRFNQSFGDAVAWDLIPDVAINSMTVEGSNPVFGLNALGGSISVQMKNGFTWDGAQLEAYGGMFDRWGVTAQYGRQDGDFAFYVAGNAMHETGWRDFSPSRLGQGFADLGWQHGQAELHLDIIGADTNLTGNGTSPVELLKVDRAAVFTWPDNQENSYGLANLHGSFQATSALSFQGNAYVGHLHQTTGNGDASDADPCHHKTELCLDDGSILTDVNGDPIPNFLGKGGVYSQLNQTATDSTSFGAAAQAVLKGDVFGVDNQILAGVTYDAGRSQFAADSLLGVMTPDRGFGGPGILIDMSNGEIAPVRVRSDNDYVGLYAADMFKPLEGLTITVSGRYNYSKIVLRDQLGTALNGSHEYGHLNPALGFTYDIAPRATFYADYAVANRAPTPAEFSCADPNTPCSLTNFFVSDPNLKQVVSHTVEAGLRGHGSDSNGGAFTWHAGIYRADANNDILFAASQITGRAFFENIGTTRRQGIEVSGDYSNGPWRFSLGYTYTDATFRHALTLNSEDNPFADPDGLIFVVPGDHLPGIPANMLKLSADYQVTSAWTVSLDGRYADGQYLRGDESNLNPKTPAYFVLNLATRYALNDTIELWGEIDNVLDTKYETFGAFSPTSDVPISEVPGASNPRSLSPAAPISLYAGVRVKL